MVLQSTLKYYVLRMPSFIHGIYRLEHSAILYHCIKMILGH